MLKRIAILLFVLVTPQAFASDTTLVDLIGYSPDGRYFAYEEFGVRDGSGAPLASITILDLDGGPVKGSPFLVDAGEDDLLPATRARVLALATPVLAELHITDPAQYVAMAGDGVPGEKGEELRFGVPLLHEPGAVEGDYLLQLATFGSPLGTICPDVNQRSLGFTLLITTSRDEQHAAYDNPSPHGIGCPLAFRLYAVVLPYSHDVKRAVALVSIFTLGWEGYNRRFLAAPIGK